MNFNSSLYILEAGEQDVYLPSTEAPGLFWQLPQTAQRIRALEIVKVLPLVRSSLTIKFSYSVSTYGALRSL
ncbi:MAG: hypothetical protein ACQEXV_22335 [Bacillota bacterium]